MPRRKKSVPDAPSQNAPSANAQEAQAIAPVIAVQSASIAPEAILNKE